MSLIVQVCFISYPATLGQSEISKSKKLQNSLISADTSVRSHVETNSARNIKPTTRITEATTENTETTTENTETSTEFPYTTTEIPTTSPEPEPSTTTVEPDSDSSSWWIWFLLIIAVLMIAGVVVYWLKTLPRRNGYRNV